MTLRAPQSKLTLPVAVFSFTWIHVEFPCSLSEALMDGVYLCSVSCTWGGPTHQIDVAPGHQGLGRTGVWEATPRAKWGGTGKSIDTGVWSVVARGWKEWPVTAGGFFSGDENVLELVVNFAQLVNILKALVYFEWIFIVCGLYFSF